MYTVGVIAEYNPFHKGHDFQLQEIRRQFPDACIVVVMSGNIVQRGEFAILDKWQRAQMALESQADLIIELPLWASLQSADHFSYWAIDLLSRLGVDHFIFGTHGIDKLSIEKALSWLSHNQVKLDEHVQRFLAQGFAYPAAMQAAIDVLDSNRQHVTFNMSEGNSLLGYQYIKANASLKDPMTFDVIARNTDYHSGSQIRQKILASENIEQLVPSYTYREFTKSLPTHWQNYFYLLKYQILSKSKEELRAIQGMKEGFEWRLKKVIHQAKDFEELVNLLTSKRWARSSVQRLLMNILLNLTQATWQTHIQNYQMQGYVRILGFKDRGKQFLNARESHCSNLIVFSNLTQKIFDGYALMIHVDEIFQLGHQQISTQNIGRFPIFLSKY